MENSDGLLWRQTILTNEGKLVTEKPALILSRPWGEILPIYLQQRFDQCRREYYRLFSLLRIHPHAQLSVQVHDCKHEQFSALSGGGGIRYGSSADSMVEKALPTTWGNSEGIVIPPGMWHQLAAGNEGVKVLEVATGYNISQSDIRRVADPFQRPNNHPDNRDLQLTEDDRMIREFLEWE